MKYFFEVKKNFFRIDDNLSCYATKSDEAVRLVMEEDDIRTPFFRDVDRIIYAMSYTRYLNKTQVYSFSKTSEAITLIQTQGNKYQKEYHGIKWRKKK